MDTSPAPDRHSRLARVAAAVAATLLAGVLTGCGVRVETPPPAEPVPDAAELVRRTAVSDALGVADAASSALEQPELPEPVAHELTRVRDHALAQADALGGEYDSGIEREPDLELDELGLEPSPAEEPPVVTTPEVVAALADAAGRSRTAANTAADGDVARLLASIGAAQTVAATRLAELAGVESPAPPQPVVPDPAPRSDDEATDDTDAEASPTAEAPEPDPTASPGVATIAPGTEEVVPPTGVSAPEYEAVILAEDTARFALEVLAARTDDADQRAVLVAKARAHDHRARGWALLAGVTGTAQDPRQAAYVLPRDSDPATIITDLAAGRARDYGTLVGAVAPGTRGVLVDLLIDAALTLDTWGAAPSAFPGMPELAGPAAG